MTGASFMVLFAAQSPTLLNILSRSSRWNLEVAALGDCGGLAEMSQLECRYYQGGKVDCVCVCTPRQWEMAGEYFPGAVRVWVLHNGHSHLIPEAIEPVHCLAFSKKVASFHRGVRPSLEVSIVVPYYIPKRIWKWRRQTVWCMQNRPQTRTGEIQRKIDAIRARTQGVDPTVYGQGQPAGFLDSNARLELMRECSCYLAPLYRKAGFGLAHHECFAAGVPVVTTTWGDMDEEMPGEYLTMSDDLEVLSVGLETLAMDEVEGPKLGNRLSEQGLQLIAQVGHSES